MPDMTTVSDRFPVVDITHKPKRMQGDNIRSAQRETVSVSVSYEGDNHVEVPQTMTLERAIRFYEENARGEFQSLYVQTAKWLRMLLSRNSVPAEEAPSKGSEE